MCGCSAFSRRVASIPSTVGIRTSIRTTSGEVARDELDHLVAVGALAHHVELVGVEQHDEGLPEPGVVVHDQHTHLAQGGVEGPGVNRHA